MRTGSLLIFTILFLFAISVVGISHGNSPVSRTAILKYKAKKYYWGRGVRQDYSRALQLYEIAAALGDPQASGIAGGMYYTGKGALPDPVKAFRYLDFAADQGKITPDASIALAGFYLQGLIVPQNYSRAIELYTASAESGNPQAQLELGKLDDRLRTLEALREPIGARLNAALNRSAQQPLPWPGSRDPRA